jgi:hypothetical protein
VLLLMGLWTLGCLAWVLFPWLQSVANPQPPQNHSEQLGQSLAYGCCMFGSASTGVVAWLAGLMPLLIALIAVKLFSNSRVSTKGVEEKTGGEAPSSPADLAPIAEDQGREGSVWGYVVVCILFAAAPIVLKFILKL